MKSPGARMAVFVITTIIFAGCGYWLYAWVQNGLLFHKDDELAFCLRLLILILPFLATLAISLIYEAEVEGSDLWKVTLSIIAICVIFGTMTMGSPLHKFIPNINRWACILQIAIPLVSIYLCSVPYVLKEQKNSAYINAEYQRLMRERESSYSSSHNTTPTDAYGRPTGKPF